MPWGALAGIVTVVVLLCAAPAGATVELAASHIPERLTGPATVVHRLDIAGDDAERRLRIEFDGGSGAWVRV